MKIYILLCFCINYAFCANILSLFPMPSMSHVRLGLELSKELANRGHNVTMITPYPQNINTTNFREISQAGLDKILLEVKKLFFEVHDSNVFLQIVTCYNLGYLVAEYTYENPDVQALLKSDATFDVVIMDQFYSEPLMGIAHYYKAPVILSSSLETPSWTHHKVGNPEQWAFMPHITMNTTSKMNFWERLLNVGLHWTEEVYRTFIAYPHHNKLLHKYMPDAPHLYDLMYNVSLIFVNSHHSFITPTARMPNVIPLGGFHVKSSMGTINKELKELLDNSKEGVIYFSMGSNLQSTEFPEEKKQAFLKAFAKLKQKILWKYEMPELPNKPDNLIISKWLPQHDILSHPNTVAFISHGGLMSTIESTALGVPVLGIPIYGDQPMNVLRKQEFGHAILLPYHEISEENILNALNELINNKTYKINAKKMSEIMFDRPMNAMDEAVYWVEYVIRHKGAPYLRSAAMDLNWFQQNCLDIYAFILAVVFAVLYFIKKMICFLFLNKHKNKKRKSD